MEKSHIHFFISPSFFNPFYRRPFSSGPQAPRGRRQGRPQTRIVKKMVCGLPVDPLEGAGRPTEGKDNRLVRNKHSNILDQMVRRDWSSIILPCCFLPVKVYFIILALYQYRLLCERIVSII